MGKKVKLITKKVKKKFECSFEKRYIFQKATKMMNKVCQRSLSVTLRHGVKVTKTKPLNRFNFDQGRTLTKGRDFHANAAKMESAMAESQGESQSARFPFFRNKVCVGK